MTVLGPIRSLCQHLSAKRAPWTGTRARFVRTTERSRRARTGTAPHRAKMNGARRRAQTPSAVRTHLNAETDNGLTPFHAPSVNAQSSIQPASRDLGTIAAHTRFPAETRGDRTPDARDERWPTHSQHGNERQPSNPA